MITTRTTDGCTWSKDWLQQEHSYDRKMFSHDPLPLQYLSAVLHHTWSSAVGEYYKHGRGPFHWWLGLREEFHSVFVKTDLVLQSKIKTLTENNQQQKTASKKNSYTCWKLVHDQELAEINIPYFFSITIQTFSRVSKYIKIPRCFFFFYTMYMSVTIKL